ncbi:MAG: recombination mediator protein UvsY [Paludibacteraceae bacterium]|nr:recombination mediator protein UvsY [Paludibacteraceae bacterium]
MLTEQQFEHLCDEAERETQMPENLEDMILVNNKLANLVQKWNRIFKKQFKICADLEIEKDTLYGDLYDKYKRNSNLYMEDKEIPWAIKRDPSYGKLCREKALQDSYLEYFKKTIDNIKSMGYEIHSYLEFKKLMFTQS